jgi:Flp pilus assembly protein protease CpaA
MIEVYVLFVLGLIWILFATIEDIRTREIANWLNFSLIIFALGFRFFYSLFEMNNFGFFYQGVIGFGIFLVLSNLFYYGKMFAGGDQKLMMALGAILPFSLDFGYNLRILGGFVFLFLIVGAIYGLVASLYFGIRNFSKFRKEFVKQLIKRRNFVIIFLIFACIFLFIGFWDWRFFSFGIFFFIIPYFYLYVKSVDEACMVRRVKTSKLTLGDWLYEDEKIGNQIVKATWDGLTEKDIKLLRKRDYVFIRFGVQFAPVFLISFILIGLIIKFGWFGF